MTQLTSRWYRDDADLERMLAVARSTIAASGVDAGILHPGDVVWGLFGNLTIDPTARVRLFEDAGGDLRAFAWLHPPRDFLITQDTARPLATADLIEIIRWAEGELGPGEPFGTEAAAGDAVADALREAGYRPTGEASFNINVQPLDASLPEPSLPPGAAVRPVNLDDPAEVAARVALHLEVWEPSKFSAEGYARLWQRPVYRPDLDLVAVTPAGELAAYCIVWWDPITRTGLFEPVGAAKAHRRQGYATALLRDGLIRLRDLGAREALVLSSTEEKYAPSRRLYPAVGFATPNRFAVWTRPS